MYLLNNKINNLRLKEAFEATTIGGELTINNNFLYIKGFNIDYSLNDKEVYTHLILEKNETTFCIDHLNGNSNFFNQIYYCANDKNTLKFKTNMTFKNNYTYRNCGMFSLDNFQNIKDNYLLYLYDILSSCTELIKDSEYPIEDYMEIITLIRRIDQYLIESQLTEQSLLENIDKYSIFPIQEYTRGLKKYQ